MFRRRMLITLLAILLLLAVAVACGGGDDGAAEEADVTQTEEETAAEVEPVEVIEGEEVEVDVGGEEGADDQDADEGEAGPGIEASGSEPGAGDDEVGAGPGVGPKVDGTALPQPTTTPANSAVPERAEGGEAVGETAELPVAAEPAGLPTGSRLTAGAVDDNAEWDAYLTYLQNYDGPAALPVDVSQRHQILVLDAQERPVLAALVVVETDGAEVARLRTHSDGRVYFFPSLLPAQQQADQYAVTVTVNGESVDLELAAAGAQREWTVIHPGATAATAGVNLDILFLLDATGSMGDEIQQLKDNIEQIAAQIAALPARPDVRFGMVIYRDRGDEFVVHSYDFTPDLATFILFLADVAADGGGDYPEDLNEALNQAVLVPEWRLEDTVSLMFLVADAPPHLDYPDQQLTYVDGMTRAAELGIKIFPIATSNLDAQGEYIFRQLAQFTGAQFIFLTYGEEGPGTTGDQTDLQVEDYTVSALDELVVQLVAAELAHRVP